MKIAIITGASSGLGTEYVKAVKEQFPEIEEYWLIARRKERLEAVAGRFKINARIMPLDLTLDQSIKELEELLCREKPDVKILINNSGFGKLGYLEDIGADVNMKICDLNVKAVTGISAAVIPYMNEGSFILNTCSIASFAPNPRMTAYCSSKAYVLSFTKSLRYELKRKKINVCAACPGPMDTEFLPAAGIGKGASHTFDTLPRVNPEKMAKRSLKAAANGKCVYTGKLFYKFYRVISKLVPHNWLMPVSKT
ncbi:MAG: SDR family NAD(P)-dependent oxidoreductase [Acutalibacteraceae bacterium]